MALVSINRNPARRELRVFAVLLGVFGGAAAAWLWMRHGATLAAALLALVTTSLALLGAAFPERIRWVYLAWMTLTFPIGWIVSHAVLAAVYFLVITPMGWLLRLRGYDPLRLRPDPEAATYWVERRPPPEANQYFRQF